MKGINVLSRLEYETNEIMHKYALDFHITKEPLLCKSEDGDYYITPYYGLRNTTTNDIINSVKSGYTVSQTKDIIEMVLKGKEKFGDDLIITNAGSINGGRKIFFQLEIQFEKKVGENIVKRYVTILDSNDGSGSLNVGISDKVMNSQNEFFKFYKEGNAKLRHTATIKDKIVSIPNLIEIAIIESYKQIELYNSWIKISGSPIYIDKFVKHVLGYNTTDTPNLTPRSFKIMNSLYDAIKFECDIVGQNLWGIFNGLTRFTTHEEKIYKDENGKMQSMMLGTNYTKALKGFEFIKHNKNFI